MRSSKDRRESMDQYIKLSQEKLQEFRKKGSMQLQMIDVLHRAATSAESRAVWSEAADTVKQLMKAHEEQTALDIAKMREKIALVQKLETDLLVLKHHAVNPGLVVGQA